MFNTNAQCYQNISQVLLTSAFILWPTCTRGFGTRVKIRCGFRFFGVFLCGFAVFRPPLRPPPGQSNSHFTSWHLISQRNYSHYSSKCFRKTSKCFTISCMVVKCGIFEVGVTGRVTLSPAGITIILISWQEFKGVWQKQFTSIFLST